MSNTPDAPPLYRPVPLPAASRVVAEAVAAAQAGAAPATLFWVDRADRAQCAVVLCPEQPLRISAQIAFIGMTALGQALGAILPPLVVVSWRIPQQILLNDAVVGTIRVLGPRDCSPDTVPDWLVVGTDIGITRFAEGSAEAADLALTTFEDEGCMGIGAGEVTGAFARYLLAWIDRWLKDGFEPVRRAWLIHGQAEGSDVEVRADGEVLTGRFAGLSDDASVLLAGARASDRIEALALVEPWSG